MARIDAFLKLGAQQGCSDVHLAVGVPPMLRMQGDLVWLVREGYVTEFIDGTLYAPPPMVDGSLALAFPPPTRVSAVTVTSGISAVRRAWRIITGPCRRPLARANRT